MGRSNRWQHFRTRGKMPCSCFCKFFHLSLKIDILAVTLPLYYRLYYFVYITSVYIAFLYYPPTPFILPLLVALAPWSSPGKSSEYESLLLSLLLLLLNPLLKDSLIEESARRPVRLHLAEFPLFFMLC